MTAPIRKYKKVPPNPYQISTTAILLNLHFIKVRQGKLTQFCIATYRKILHDKPFVFVGQGADKNTYENALKAKPCRAYGVLSRYAFRQTTSNKKSSFVMLRHAKYLKIYFDKVRRKYSIKSPISFISHRTQFFYMLLIKLHSVKVRQRRKPCFIKKKLDQI